ncbi:uncharacterized protein LOC131637728 [Vicia villosa]|uniref:uncharacterized protein LOC131637728 n=1 Tax=Vicia villosa TaxID=3911 RepID=UPI00273C03D9|nr:uncharacterized protein LOC131637728 [Vicia villosa]
MHWLRHGDSNSKFFHRSTTVRNKFKKITTLLDETGAEVKGQEELCHVAKSYFEQLFEMKQGVHDPVLNCISPVISQEDNRKLLTQITKAELFEALTQMHPDKSPGPDGFNPAFYQHFWELCGDDIFMAASTWLERGFFPSELNETNICLIPKCIVLNKCVSEEQSAFVEGRSILDNALVAPEIIHSLKRKTAGIALKIDISKAYDRVDWGFLRGVLLRMGFDENWIHWLMMCVSSVHYSVLVNSDRIGPIIPGRGLRQGDPLSPANIVEASNLMEILNIYTEANGQEINLAKSEVFFSRNLSGPAQEDLAQLMGVRRVLGTGKYLGLPSMIGRSKKAVFSFIKDRIWKRINSWSGRSLSKAGKEVMIKSVLQSIPAYIMSVYLIPDGVVNDIEKMLNSFWWGGGGNNKGIRWLAWDRMTTKKSEGGWGLEILNPLIWLCLWKAKAVIKQGCRWSIGDGSNIKDVKEDRLIWNEEQNGEYSVKSGYKIWNGLHSNTQFHNTEGRWKSIWSISAPPRAKHLLWRICKECLPTRTKLQQRHVQCPSVCPWCEGEDEDDWHIFFACVSITQSWRAAGLSSIIDPRLPNFNDAKSLIFDVCSREDRRDAGRFAVLLETLWRSRNNKVWQDIRDDALRIGIQAYHNWYDWFLAREEHNLAAGNNLPISWIPPSVNHLKCNVDAAWHDLLKDVVSNFIHNHYWNIPQQVTDYCPNILSIMNKVVIPIENREDCSVWKLSDTGDLSLKQAYDFKCKTNIQLYWPSQYLYVVVYSSRWQNFYLSANRYLEAMRSELESAMQDSGSVHPPRSLVTKEIFWVPPLENWVKANTDREANNITSACGGIFRSSTSDFIVGFVENLGLHNAFYAEISGAMRAIEVA